MTERPIIMQGESVRAILEGRKTQTRRVITHRHGIHFLGGVDLFRGELVVWLHVPRGGYGYVCPVEAKIVTWSRDDVTIEVCRATGETVRRKVKISSLRRKGSGRHVYEHLAEGIRKISGGDR